MANRTLGRAYSGTPGSEKSAANINDSSAGKPIADENGDGTTGNDESTANIDGANNGGNTDSVSSIGSVEIDPAELDSYIADNGSSNRDGNSSGTGKRRGRKPGSTNRKSGAAKAQASLEPFILMLHSMMATKVPEMMLTPDEAKRVADVYTDFCEHHEIPILSAKRMSEINMVTMMFAVYGTRIVAIRNRMKEEDRVKKARNVTHSQPQPITIREA